MTLRSRSRRTACALLATFGLHTIQTTLFISSVGQRTGQVFREGGPVLGEFFQAIGRFAQMRAADVLVLYQRFNPDLQIEDEVRAGSRFIDFFVKIGQRGAFIEAKYGLPWRRGEALTRLVDQVNSAIATGRGQVVLWSLRAPTTAQVNLVNQELGPTAATQVQFVHGVEGLMAWLRLYFGPV